MEFYLWNRLLHSVVVCCAVSEPVCPPSLLCSSSRTLTWPWIAWALWAPRPPCAPPLLRPPPHQLQLTYRHSRPSLPRRHRPGATSHPPTSPAACPALPQSWAPPLPPPSRSRPSSPSPPCRCSSPPLCKRISPALRWGSPWKHSLDCSCMPWHP